MKFQPRSEKDIAGITCLQSESFHYVLGVTKKDKDDYLILAKTSGAPSQGGAAGKTGSQTVVLEARKIKSGRQIILKVKAAEGDQYQFSYSLDGRNFHHMGAAVSGDILSTNVAGGFTGALIGLYASSGNSIQP